MKEIKLTRGKVAIVDDEDFERLNKLNWYALSIGYAARRHLGRLKYMHHFICPKPVDHINGNGFDNRRCNLRTATQHQNSLNQKVRVGTSKFKGVSWDKHAKKWTAQIHYNGKKTHLGCFNSEIEAAKIYNRTSKRMFGKFARLNVIGDTSEN